MDILQIAGKKYLAAGLVILQLLLLHCSEENPHQSYVASFNFNIIDPVETSDPLHIIYQNDWILNSLLYEGLLGYTEDNDVLEPLLAEKWEVSDDKLIYRFFLRKNVCFHDDPCFNNKQKILSADDVIFSFERMASKSSGNVYWSLFKDKIIGINDFHNGESSNIKGINKISDSIIEFQLTKPVSSFLKILALPSAAIIPKAALDKYGHDFKYHPVGTGAFKLVYWKPMEEIFLVKNPLYWKADKNNNKYPYLDEISFKLIENRTLLLPELLKGNNHILSASYGLANELKSDQEFMKRFEIYTSNALPSIRFWGIASDKDNVLTSNKKLRRLISHKFHTNFYDSNLSRSVNFTSTLAPIDLHFENHKSLNGGISTYKKKSVTISASINSPALDELLIILSDLGINAQVEIITSGYYNYIINDRPDIFRVSMTPTFPDYCEYYNLFYSETDKNINLTRYKNVQFDNLFKELMLTSNDSIRKILFGKMEYTLNTDACFIPISNSKPDYFIIPKDIKNFKLRYAIPDFRTLKMTSDYEN